MKKERKKKSPEKIMVIIFNILIFVSMAFLMYTLSLISGIEKTIVIIGIITIFIVNILLVILINKLNKKKSLIRYLLFLIFASILICGQCFLGYFIMKTYSSLDNMNKSKITYTSAIVTLKDKKYNIDEIKNKKIGIVVDKTSIDGYIIGLEIIKDKKLEDNNTIVEYDSNSSLMSDLYNKTLDLIIISKNYPSMFKTIENYNNIEEDTKIIYEKSKTLTKKEIAKYSGEEIVNLNKSNSVTEPFTLLVMGIDSTEENLEKNASGNGDALMLVTFNPKTLNATILSIPRDSYVPIACFANQKENKITHAGWNGASCMIKTIENFTGINIDYYVKINFKGVVNLVDALGGIDIDVPIEFCEQDSNRNFNNLQCLKKGYQNINGEQALALARHRKTLLTGDLQRGQNQQVVANGIINKLKTVKSANQALKILDSISKSMDTNFTTKQMLSFYEIGKTIIATSSSDNLINLQQLYLYGSSEYIYDESMGMVLYNYIINKDSLKQVVEAMKKNLGDQKVATTKTMDFNIEEKFELSVIGKDNLGATTLYILLPNFTGNSLEYAKAWLSQHNIKVNVIEEETTEYKDGIIISQNMPESKRIDLIGSNGITFTVAKSKNNIIENKPSDDGITEDYPDDDKKDDDKKDDQKDDQKDDNKNNTENNEEKGE